jgi:hypothetical protein
MIINLLLITFFLSLVIACLVAWFFRKPVTKVMTRIVDDQLGFAWVRYLTGAIIVVGVGGGVRPWDYEKYITPVKDQPVLVLNSDRWVLEIYRTVIGTLCANMSETSSPSTITVGRGKKSHFDKHRQDEYFFRCQRSGRRIAGPQAVGSRF